jgi:exopolysaccharide biosynthesis polyprenyl glycosylphosphotransferase
VAARNLPFPEKLNTGSDASPIALIGQDTVSASLCEEENHLGYPRFARMPAQTSELPRAGSVRLSFLVTDLLLSVMDMFVVLYVSESLSWHGIALGRLNPEWPRNASVNGFYAFLIVYSIITALLCRHYGLYDTSEPQPLLQRGFSLLKAMTLASILLATFARLAHLGTISPLEVACAGVLNLIAFASWRLLNRQLTANGMITARRTRNVMLVGSPSATRRLANSLERDPYHRYLISGFVEVVDQSSEAQDQSPPRRLTRIQDISRIARANFVDEILIALPMARDLVLRVLSQARFNRLDVKVAPEIYDEIGQSSLPDYVGSIPLIPLHRESISEKALIIKRCIDVVLSLGLLVVSAPLFLLIAIAIKLDSPGPVFYCSPRVGKKGRRFTFYKFRTMVADADRQKERLRKMNERSGPFFKISNDPRITRAGAFLRKFSLDELPQLGNVLKGDMSLVGPRPHPLDDYASYELEHLRRLDVMPGITGLWQVTARKDPSFERNLALDLQYIEHWSPWEDLKILVQTVPVVFRPQGE